MVTSTLESGCREGAPRGFRSAGKGMEAECWQPLTASRLVSTPLPGAQHRPLPRAQSWEEAHLLRDAGRTCRGTSVRGRVPGVMSPGFGLRGQRVVECRL